MGENSSRRSGAISIGTPSGLQMIQATAEQELRKVDKPGKG